MHSLLSLANQKRGIWCVTEANLKHDALLIRSTMLSRGQNKLPFSRGNISVRSTARKSRRLKEAHLLWSAESWVYIMPLKAATIMCWYLIAMLWFLAKSSSLHMNAFCWIWTANSGIAQFELYEWILLAFLPLNYINITLALLWIIRILMPVFFVILEESSWTKCAKFWRKFWPRVRYDRTCDFRKILDWLSISRHRIR